MKRQEAELFASWETRGRTYPWTVTHFLETIDSPISETIVMEEDGEAVGFAVVQVIDSEGYILNVMIEPMHRRQGRGARLLGQVMDFLKKRGASDVFLDVEAGNVGAIRLYEKGGFHMVTRRRKSYPRGEDSIVMKKDISYQNELPN